MNTPRWNEFKRFFKLKDGEGEDPRKPIHILGLSRPAFAYQLYGAWWMFNNERTIVGGGYNADHMGMGKVCTHSLNSSTHLSCKY